MGEFVCFGLLLVVIPTFRFRAMLVEYWHDVISNSLIDLLVVNVDTQKKYLCSSERVTLGND